MKLQTSESASCPPCAFTDILPSSDSAFCCTGVHCFPPAPGRYRQPGLSRRLLTCSGLPRPHGRRRSRYPHPAPSPRPSGPAAPSRRCLEPTPTQGSPPVRSLSPPGRHGAIPFPPPPGGGGGPRAGGGSSQRGSQPGPVAAAAPSREGRAGVPVRSCPAGPLQRFGEGSPAALALFGCGLSGSSAAASPRSAPLPSLPFPFPPPPARPRPRDPQRPTRRATPRHERAPHSASRPQPRPAASPRGCTATPLTAPHLRGSPAKPGQRPARCRPPVLASPPSSLWFHPAGIESALLTSKGQGV